MSLPHTPRSRAPRLLLFTLTAFLATVAAASAATPLNVGSAATSPRPVVDDAGTGYVSWADASSSQVLKYCRLAQGTTACNATQSFAYPANVGGVLTEGNSPVIVSAGRILIVDARCCVTGQSGGRFVYSSTDGGTSFTPTAPSTTVASGANGMQGNVLFAAPSSFDPAITTERLLTIADTAITDGADFQGMPTTASGSTAQFGIDPDTSVIGTGSSSIALQGTTLLAAYTDTNQKVFTRRYDGGGNENLAANWSAPVFVADAGDYDSELLTGTTAYLTYPDATNSIVLRQYDGSGWGAPVAMTPTGVHFYTAAEDPSGIVHIAYVDDTGTLKYRYARSSANNDFTNPQVLGSGSSSYFDLRLAVTSAGNGFLAWNDHTNGFVLPIVPGEGPADGSDTIDGDTKPLDPDTDIVLTVPANCTPTNSEFTVAVALKKHKKHHRVEAAKKKTKRKIVSAAFYKGNLLITKVKHKPFKATISTADVSSGTLVISVKVKIKVKKPGHKVKKVKKTLKASVKIC